MARVVICSWCGGVREGLVGRRALCICPRPGPVKRDPSYSEDHVRKAFLSGFFTCLEWMSDNIREPLGKYIDEVEPAEECERYMKKIRPVKNSKKKKDV